MRQNEKELTLHIDWDQARDILIGWEQLVVTPHWLVETCNGIIGWAGLVTSFSLVGIRKGAVLIGGIEDCGASFWQRAQFVTSLLAGIRRAACYVLIGKDQGYGHSYWLGFEQMDLSNVSLVVDFRQDIPLLYTYKSTSGKYCICCVDKATVAFFLEKNDSDCSIQRQETYERCLEGCLERARIVPQNFCCVNLVLV
jgi:hypothetical protein